jgi:hypothetical protein
LTELAAECIVAVPGERRRSINDKARTKEPHQSSKATDGRVAKAVVR